MSCHVKMASGTSIIWFLLSQFSQSTLYRRNGTNACTFIALLLPKFYFLHKSALSSSKYKSLLLNWINLFINCISLGNHIHDRWQCHYRNWVILQCPRGNSFSGSYYWQCTTWRLLWPIHPEWKSNGSSKISGILFRTAHQRRQSCYCCNHEWNDHQPGWTKQQHYSHRWPLTWSTWCHGWLNQYW